MDDTALQELQTNFRVELLDRVVQTAYNPTDPQRAQANKVLMAFQQVPDVWTKADAILETSQQRETKFFALQILDDVIQTR
jgi:exportin-1